VDLKDMRSRQKAGLPILEEQRLALARATSEFSEMPIWVLFPSLASMSMKIVEGNLLNY